MSSFVLGFQDIDKTKLMVVGGKGANLGELSRIDGIIVPEGFCITTEAYKRIISQTPEFNDLLEQLYLLKVEDRERICEISKKIRSVIEGTVIAKEIDEAVTHFITKLGDKNAYAVRSSATAEDLPTASFADQQVLGVALYGPCGDLPDAERVRPQKGPSVCGHPENGLPGGSRDHVYS